MTVQITGRWGRYPVTVWPGLTGGTDYPGWTPARTTGVLFPLFPEFPRLKRLFCREKGTRRCGAAGFLMQIPAAWVGRQRRDYRPLRKREEEWRVWVAPPTLLS